MNTIEITISRTVAASPEQVFDVWLDTTRAGGPWHGVERVILNPVVDGLFYFGVGHQGRQWAHYGRFVRVERPGCLEYTWVSEATHGLESVVAITFAAVGAQTEVTLRHSGIPDDEIGRQHEQGWTWVLSTTAEHFAGAPA